MTKTADYVRTPRINLIDTRRPAWHTKKFSVGWRSLGLIVVALVSWTVAGIGVALMLGWHPQLSSGP